MVYTQNISHCGNKRVQNMAPTPPHSPFTRPYQVKFRQQATCGRGLPVGMSGRHRKDADSMSTSERHAEMYVPCVCGKCVCVCVWSCAHSSVPVCVSVCEAHCSVGLFVCCFFGAELRTGGDGGAVCAVFTHCTQHCTCARRSDGGSGVSPQ